MVNAFDSDSEALGVFDDVAYTEGKLQLHSGDRLLLFTDGLSEATDENGDQFGEERLIQLLRDHRDLGADELQEMILRTVSDFCRNRFEDDAALMMVAVE